MIIQKPSPNFNTGRSGHKPEIIVLHVMAGTLVGTDDWFIRGSKAQGEPVSAHYGIGFTGETHQYVADENTAWHAGAINGPSFKLYKPGVNPNLYTIGIEHEGNDLNTGPDTQINASVNLIQTLSAKWNIPIDRDHIIGHYQIDAVNRANCPAINKSIIDTIISKANLLKPTTAKDVLVKKVGELQILINEL